MPLVLLTLVVLLNRANAQSKPGPEKHKTTAAVGSEQPKQDDQVRVALIAALQAITNQEKAAAKQSRAESESWFSTTFVQRGLLVVGIVYSLVALLQWCAMRESLQVSERAYVNVNRVEIIAPETLDAVVFTRTTFVFRNSGKTPAKHLLVEVDGEIVKEARSKKMPTDTDSIWRTPFEGMTLPPDTEHRVRFDFPEPDAFIKSDKVRAGELYAVCWATVSYEDQFGVSHDSIEPFCYDPVAQNFDRHFIGFKESSRRNSKADGYQWVVRSWFRDLIKRFS